MQGIRPERTPVGMLCGGGPLAGFRNADSKARAFAKTAKRAHACYAKTAKIQKQERVIEWKAGDG